MWAPYAILLLLPLLPAAHRSPPRPPLHRPPTLRPPLAALAFASAYVRGPSLCPPLQRPVIGVDQCLNWDWGWQWWEIGGFFLWACGSNQWHGKASIGLGHRILGLDWVWSGSMAAGDMQEWRRRHGQGACSVEKWKDKIEGGEDLEGGRECSPVV